MNANCFCYDHEECLQPNYIEIYWRNMVLCIHCQKIPATYVLRSWFTFSWIKSHHKSSLTILLQ